MAATSDAPRSNSHSHSHSHSEAHAHASGDPGNAGESVDAYGIIGPVYALAKAQEWLFVMRSVGLDGAVRELEPSGWGVVVPTRDYEKALATVGAYEEENRDYAPRRRRDRPLYGSSPWAAAIVALMVGFFFAVTGPARTSGAWFRAGTADAARLLHGAPWQAMTALTLHADTGHVVGNALSGFVFLSAVHRRLGPGLGTFTVLAAGAAGNALNAWYHLTRLGEGHRSVGASTAVFAAVGVLAATQSVVNQTAHEGRLATWGPIAGGLVLLGMLGASQHSDVYAHGFGFAAGVALGFVAAIAVRARTKPLPKVVEAGFGLASVASVVGAWALAFHAGT